MNSYRLYVLSPQERIADAREAEFPDDDTALAQAGEMRRDAYAVEVWTGERLVGRVGGEFHL
jgi:hypothetical protein